MINLTRQAVDAAEPLSFEPPGKPAALATLTYQGVPVQVDLMSLTEATLGGIERRIDKLLSREGWAAQPVQTRQQPAQRRVTTMPDYDANGTPLCPKHGKPLREGRYGLYCSCKDDAGRNGYCDLRFAA